MVNLVHTFRVATFELACNKTHVIKQEKRDLEEEARLKKTDDVTTDDLGEEPPLVEEEDDAADKERNSEPDSDADSEGVEEVDDNKVSLFYSFCI